MNVIYEKGCENFAKVYVAQLREDKRYVVEFVESLTLSEGIDKKFVIIVSSHFGCPIGCKFCDSGTFYYGALTTEEIIKQVDYIVKRRFSSLKIHTEKFKVQFARMGEPSLNDNVLNAIVEIMRKYEAPGYMPCISTVAPRGRESWFDNLAEINRNYFKGWFQLQFSVHSTNEDIRNYIIPIKKWSLTEIARYGEDFYCGRRKITLNFALTKDANIDAYKIIELFNPEIFAIKITPVNPTHTSRKHGLVNIFTEKFVQNFEFVRTLKKFGYETHISIGPLEENEIGSNCGQIVYNMYQRHS